MSKPKVVIDTNIFISSLIGKTISNPRTIITAFKKDNFSLIISRQLLKELEETAREPELSSLTKESEVFNLITLIELKATIIDPKHTIRICRDPKDNIVLATAITGSANLIVTGDNDLLILRKFCNIPIITPKDFLKRLKKK